MDPNEAVAELSVGIAENTAAQVGLDESHAMTFLPILIELLPILADLLSRNCAPDNAEGLRALEAAPGVRGRVFRWQYTRAMKQVIGNPEDYSEWGKTMGDNVLTAITDTKNDALVTAALKAKPAPIWGLFEGAA